ncbi:MAG: hypothetical protein NT080_09770 [Spirochaetes bacterium]|nr:hypothetical protein [Spirochaetota bacterium]
MRLIASRFASVTAFFLCAALAAGQQGARPADAFSRLSEKLAKELGNPEACRKYGLLAAPDPNGLTMDELLLHFSPKVSDLDALGEQYSGILARISGGATERDAKASCGFAALSLAMVFEEFAATPDLVTGILPAGSLPGIALFAERPVLDRLASAIAAMGKGRPTAKFFIGKQESALAFVRDWCAAEKPSYPERRDLVEVMSFSRESVKRYFDRALDSVNAVAKVKAFMKLYGDYLAGSGQLAEEEFAGLLSALFDKKLAGKLRLTSDEVKAALSAVAQSLSPENKYRAWLLSEKEPFAMVEAAAARQALAAPLRAFYGKLDAGSLNALLAADFEGQARFAADSISFLKGRSSPKGDELLAGLRAEKAWALAAIDGRLSSPPLKSLAALLEKWSPPAGSPAAGAPLNPYPLIRRFYEKLDDAALAGAARWGLAGQEGYFSFAFLRDPAATLTESPVPADRAALVPALATLASKLSAFLAADPAGGRAWRLAGEPGFLFANAFEYGTAAPEFARACDALFNLKKARGIERSDWLLKFAPFVASDPKRKSLGFMRGGGLPAQALDRLFRETDRFDELVAILAQDDRGVLVSGDLALQVLQFRMAEAGRDTAALVKLGSANEALRSRMASVGKYIARRVGADRGFAPPADALVAYVAAMRGAEDTLAVPKIDARNVERTLDLAAAVLLLWDPSVARSKDAAVAVTYAFRLVEAIAAFVEDGAPDAGTSAKAALADFAAWDYKGVLDAAARNDTKKNAVEIKQIFDAIGYGL